MRIRLILLCCFLAPVAGAGACASTSAGATLSGWPDIPVPQGFHQVRDAALEAAVDVGGYRAGEFLLEGRSQPAVVEQYYRSRMPLHGWTWDEGMGCWSKGTTLVSVDITPCEIGAYENEPGSLNVRLRVRSFRPGFPSE